MKLKELKKLNPKWWSRETMNFFKTKVIRYDEKTGYMITSETDPAGVTKYTIRLGHDDGRISNVSEFHFYADLDDAIHEYVKLKRGETC